MSGPQWPVARAAAMLRQPPQPALAKTALPAVGAPFSLNAGVSGSRVAFGSVPMTVTGVGLVTPSEPQPARTTAARHENEIRTSLRTGRDFTWHEYHRKHEAQVV